MGMRERMNTWTRENFNPRPAADRTLTHDEVVEVARQVVAGEPAPRREGRARRAARRRLADQVAAIRARGDIVDLPVEDAEAG